MADIADVEQALVAAVSLALYPTGVGASGSGSVLGVPCRIRRGWVNAEDLNVDLAVGVVNVTVFARNGMTQATTRYPRQYTDAIIGAVPITVSVSGSAITFAGTGGSVQLAGIANSAGAYAIATTLTDTPATVAAKLAALAPGASAVGAVVTMPGVHVIGRVGSVNTALLETRRQKQGFLVSVWCASSAMRDRAAAAIDSAMSLTDFIGFADGSGGQLRYAGDTVLDAPSKGGVWRRDIAYTVDYPTTSVLMLATMLFGVETIKGGSGASIQSII